MACRSGVIALAAAVGLLVQGCASPGQPVTQTLRVETPGCAQVACELSNDRGSWVLPRTPGTITLTTSNAPLQVSCRAEDGALGGTTSGSSMAPTTGAGAVTGGVVGGAAVGAAVGGAALAFIPPLGIIAVLTGAAAGAATGQAVESNQRSLRYPALISVPMDCAPVASAARPAGAVLGLGIRGLQLAAARERGVGERGAVLVTSVAAGGPAAAAGLRSGDIILAADGHELGDAADPEERLLALPPGTPLALRVWRDGQWLAIVLTSALAAERNKPREL